MRQLAREGMTMVVVTHEMGHKQAKAELNQRIKIMCHILFNN